MNRSMWAVVVCLRGGQFIAVGIVHVIDEEKR
jgi:hypothetical protein